MSVAWAESQRGCRARWRRLAAVLAIAAPVALSAPPAFGKPKSGSDDGPVCDKAAASDDDDNGDKDSGLTYALGLLCVGISGDVQATGQAADVSEPRFGSAANSQRSLTLKPDLRIESALPTSLGKLKTAFEIDWSYVTSTGPEQTPNLDEATVSYVGVTAGYADSLMNFWDSSDFQFTIAAPNRSSYLVSYERAWTDELTATIAVEAGPPSTRGADSWRLPNTPPYYTVRLRYEKDDWTLHASGAFHELETRAPPLLTGPLERRQGWATTLGVTIPFNFVHEDDSATLQASYAVNSSIFLGTQSDISFLAAVVPTTGPTVGWSALAAYVHNWNDKWTSNLFVSQLALSVDLQRANPSVKTTRTGANLVYQIGDHWQVGAEIDYVNARFDLNGTFGIINGANLSGATGYLWVKWEF